MAGRKITKDVEYFFNDIVDLNWSQNRVGEFKKKVIEQLWTIDFWPMGRSVIEAIVKKAKGNVYDNHLQIKKHAGASNYKEFHKGLGIVPDHPILYLDLTYFERKPYKIDPTQDYVVRCKKMYVYLFHELLHFYHDLTGSFSGTLQEEYRTVGLYNFKNDNWTENAFRKALRLPRRPCYTWKRETTNNPALYNAEKRKRAQLNLPEQSTLTSSSQECRH